MAVILNWKNTIKESKERFITSFFSFISSGWYIKNVINSPDADYLDAYDFIDVYSEEFYLANQEVIKTFNDLSIADARTTNIALRGTSKLYDNFGADIFAAKNSFQYFDTYNSLDILQTYRQELRFLSKAYIEGTSLEALKDIGYAFTGISPLIEDPSHQYDGWVLTSYTGSVKYVGEDFIVTDFIVPHIGSIFFTNVSLFDEGDEVKYSFSKLGTNTKLKSKTKYNSEHKLLYYTNNSSSVIKNSIAAHVSKLVRADIKPIINYSNKCVFYRPSAPSGGSIFVNSDMTISPQGFLYNTQRLFPTGSVVTTPVIGLPSDYRSYNWFYDWMINLKNSGNYRMEIRSYPVEDIPDTVPYDLYTQDFPELLFNGDLSLPHAHWKFNHTSSLFDISGNNFTLPLQTSSDFVVNKSRHENQYCFTNLNSYDYRAYKTGFDFSKPLRYELWVKGLDASIGSPAYFEIASIKDGSNYNKLYIDGVNKRLGLKLNNSGVIQDAFADISDIFNEVSERYHYLGLSYIPIATSYDLVSYFNSAIMGTSVFSTISTSSIATGKILFYLDGKLLGEQTLTVNPPTFSDITDSVPPILSVNMTGSGITFDEILMSEGFLDESSSLANYERSRSRIHRTGIPSSSVYQYHQAKITFYAYDEDEVEFHQFSIRGAQNPIYKVRGRGYASIFTHPIFSS